MTALHNRLQCVASNDGQDGSLSIHQNASMYLTTLRATDCPGDQLRYTLAPGRVAYVHLAQGCAGVNGLQLQGGDGAYIDAAITLQFTTADTARIALFDLPPRSY